MISYGIILSYLLPRQLTITATEPFEARAVGLDLGCWALELAQHCPSKQARQEPVGEILGLC